MGPGQIGGIAPMGYGGSQGYTQSYQGHGAYQGEHGGDNDVSEYKILVIYI